MSVIVRPLVFILLVAGPVTIAAAAGPDKVLATVNGEPVTVVDYQRFLLKNDLPAEDGPVVRELLNKLIEERLIVQEAKEKGVVVSDEEVDQSIREFIARNKLAPGEFEKTITGRGMTVAEYKIWLKENIIVMARMLDAEVDRKVSVTDKELADYYGQNRDLFIKTPEKDTVGAIVMVLSENPSAEEITDMKVKSLRLVAELRKGASFEEMASLHSAAGTAEQKGMMGDFRRGQLTPALDGALSALKEGEVSDPVWVREGVFILKLIKRTGTVYLPLEAVKEAVRTTLLAGKKERAYKRWVRALWEKASITIN